MKRALGAVIVTGLLGVAGAAKAETKPVLKPSTSRFSLADLDQDGTITRAELLGEVSRVVQRQVAQRFGKLDRNRDGRVARSEVPSMDAQRFARFDLNRDGVFTQSELGVVMGVQVTERVEQLFVQLDADQDGRFSQVELALPAETDTAIAKGEQKPAVLSAKNTAQAKF
jgi:Ca2+-binding EF-hand superfamily protein